MSQRLLECEDVVQHIFAWLPPGRTIAGVILAHRSFYSALNEIEPRVEQLDTIVEHRRQSYFTAPLSDPAGLVRYQLQLVELAKQQRQAARDAIYPQAEHFDSLREQLEVAIGEPMKNYQEVLSEWQHLNKADFSESRCYMRPPQPLVTSIDAFLTAACHIKIDCSDVYLEWKKLSGNYNGIFQVFENMQPLKLAESQPHMDKLKILLELPEMEEHMQRKVSRMGAVLARISRASYYTAQTLQTILPLHKEFVALQAKMAPCEALAAKVDLMVARLRVAHQAHNMNLRAPRQGIENEQMAGRTWLEKMQAMLNLVVQDDKFREMLVETEEPERKSILLRFKKEMKEVKFRQLSSGSSASGRRRSTVSHTAKTMPGLVTAKRPSGVAVQQKHFPLPPSSAESSQIQTAWRLPESLNSTPQKTPAGHAALMLRASSRH